MRRRQYPSLSTVKILEGRKPEQWSIVNIIPIPKTGDISKGNNYRGMSLSSLVAKTYNRMILNRIPPALEPHLRINQMDLDRGEQQQAKF